MQQNCFKFHKVNRRNFSAVMQGNVGPPQNIFWNNNRVKAGKRQKAEEAACTKALRRECTALSRRCKHTRALGVREGVITEGLPKGGDLQEEMKL